MNKTLKVTVTGTAGSGKSSLAHGIKNLCEKYGIECAIDGAEDGLPGLLGMTWKTRLKSVADKKINVEITTIQANRRGL